MVGDALTFRKNPDVLLTPSTRSLIALWGVRRGSLGTRKPVGQLGFVTDLLGDFG